jgi:hypothetical protein
MGGFMKMISVATLPPLEGALALVIKEVSDKFLFCVFTMGRQQTM